MEFYWRVVAFFTLWKTSIQSVEGKHGTSLQAYASVYCADEQPLILCRRAQAA